MADSSFSRARVIAVLCAAALSWTTVSRADEAPTILIEDVIMTCTTQVQSTSMPSVTGQAIDQGRFERRYHRIIAKTCQGHTVCRIDAAMLLTPEIRNSPCDDVVIVPVCALGPFENLMPDSSPEMTLPLRETGYLVINCSGRANPHF